MRSAIAAALLGAISFIPQTVSAQTPVTERPWEIALSTGTAKLWHGDDSLGWGTTLGAELTVRVLPRLALRFTGHRSFGPGLREWSCASETAPCSGIAHSGIRDLSIWSGEALYYFGSRAARPFVVGGLDVLHFTARSSVITSRAGQVTITELKRINTTMGIMVGAGLHVPVGGRMSLTPELKVYDGTMLAGANLWQVRMSLAVGYRW